MRKVSRNRLRGTDTQTGTQIRTRLCLNNYFSKPAWPSGKTLGCYAVGPTLDSPLWLTVLLRSCGLRTLSREFALHNQWNIKMAHIAAHLNAEIILLVTVWR